MLILILTIKAHLSKLPLPQMTSHSPPPLCECKAAGTDGTSGHVLKACAEQLSFLFTINSIYWPELLFPSPQSLCQCLNKPLCINVHLSSQQINWVCCTHGSSLNLTEIIPISMLGYYSLFLVCHLIHSFSSAGGLDIAPAIWQLPVQIPTLCSLGVPVGGSPLLHWKNGFNAENKFHIVHAVLCSWGSLYFSLLLCWPTSPPPDCVLSPLLYSLFIHDCVPVHGSKSVIRFHRQHLWLQIPLCPHLGGYLLAFNNSRSDQKCTVGPLFSEEAKESPPVSSDPWTSATALLKASWTTALWCGMATVL